MIYVYNKNLIECYGYNCVDILQLFVNVEFVYLVDKLVEGTPTGNTTCCRLY